MWIVYIQKITLVTKRRTERQAVIFIQKIKIRKVKKVKIMCYSRKVEPSVIEREMQESRNKEEFIGKVETITIKQIVENAKINSRFGDKILVNINPLHVHIPSWQRMCDVVAATEIGTKYNKYKWEVPKLLYLDGKLWCVDGMHRIYGAFKGKIKAVICEIIECSEKEAIKLFLGQGVDRRKMSQVDYYRAAIEYGDEKYIQLKEICNNHNVAVKGDPIENQVGIFTPIKDDIKSIRKNGTELLDKIITLITDLQWNGYADTYNGKAYTAKYIRVMHSLYAYYEGRTEQMENILKEKCIGTEFFVENIMNLEQCAVFDYLSEIVRYEMESPFTEKKRKTTKKTAKVNVI